MYVCMYVCMYVWAVKNSCRLWMRMFISYRKERRQTSHQLYPLHLRFAKRPWNIYIYTYIHTYYIHTCNILKSEHLNTQIGQGVNILVVSHSFRDNEMCCIHTYIHMTSYNTSKTDFCSIQNMFRTNRSISVRPQSLVANLSHTYTHTYIHIHTSFKFK